jgi:hypothetical protein
MGPWASERVGELVGKVLVDGAVLTIASAQSYFILSGDQASEAFHKVLRGPIPSSELLEAFSE